MMEHERLQQQSCVGRALNSKFRGFKRRYDLQFYEKRALVEPPTPDVEPPTPDVEPPTPDVEPPTPDVEPPTPDVEPPTPDVEPPTPDVEPPTPVVEPPTPDVEPPTPDVEPPTPDVEPPTPDVENLLTGNHDFPPDTLPNTTVNRFSYFSSENEPETKSNRVVLMEDFNTPGLTGNAGCLYQIFRRYYILPSVSSVTNA